MSWLATSTCSRATTAEEVAHKTAAARRESRGQVAVQPAPVDPLGMHDEDMHAARNRSQIDVSTVSREPGRPLTANSLAAAPDGEEADAGNEDDGAADHERSPGLGCRPQRHNNTKVAGGQRELQLAKHKTGFPPKRDDADGWTQRTVTKKLIITQMVRVTVALIMETSHA